jgi:hypothetical protein
MYPPHGATGRLIGAADAFDLPVFVRRNSPLEPERRPLPSRIGRARETWPTVGDIPPGGEYLVTATWRDVIDAALTVGRDPSPWFAQVPGLAWSECIARCSPLLAYLGLRRYGSQNSRRSGCLIEPNIMYSKGTERTGQAAFAYRIGMTMAEWVCRRLMGLGPTLHAEVKRPPEAGPMWRPLSNASLPDLVGDHWRDPITWIVEAKGARRLGQPELRKGARQVTRCGLMSGPHVRVLCGTSLEHRLFMTVDAEISDFDGQLPSSLAVPDLAQSDEELVAQAFSRMLTYYSLTALPSAEQFISPLGRVVGQLPARQRRAAQIYPLEDDASTREERELARDVASYEEYRALSERHDMLTGRVPGTGIVLGMSRRLFGACRGVAAEVERIAAEVREEYPEWGLTELEEAEAVEHLPRGFRAYTEDEDSEDGVQLLEEEPDEPWLVFVDRMADSQEQIRNRARAGFEFGMANSWDQMGAPARLNPQPPAGMLEGATTDTYLAVDLRSVVPLQV